MQHQVFRHVLLRSEWFSAHAALRSIVFTLWVWLFLYRSTCWLWFLVPNRLWSSSHITRGNCPKLLWKYTIKERLPYEFATTRHKSQKIWQQLVMTNQSKISRISDIYIFFFPWYAVCANVHEMLFILHLMKVVIFLSHCCSLHYMV